MDHEAEVTAICRIVVAPRFRAEELCSTRARSLTRRGCHELGHIALAGPQCTIPSSLRIVDECHWYSETPQVRGSLGQILSDILRWNATQWSSVATPLKCAGGGVRFSKWQAVASRNAGRSIKRKSGSDYDSANCCNGYLFFGYRKLPKQSHF